MSDAKSRISFMETWVPSRFNVSVDLPERRKAVFNTSSLALVKMDRGIWRRHLHAGAEYYLLRDTPPAQMPRFLYDRGFLVPQSVDEVELLRLKYAASRWDGDWLAAYVAPTHACNLRCRYCFAGLARSLQPLKLMDRRTEDAVVCYLAGQARGRKNVNISWYGGEPRLGLRTIRRISSLLIPAFDKAGVNYSASFVTNGVLLDRKAWDVLRRCRVRSVQITVDVPKSEKRDRQGNDTLERALDGAKIVACGDSGVEVTLRVNISRDVEAQFDALWRSLLRRGLEKQLHSLILARVTRPECGPPSRRYVPTKPEDFVRILARERVKARALGFPVETLSLRPPGTTCTSSRVWGMVIDPDGLVYKCPMDMGLTDRAYASVFDTHVRLSNLLPWLTYSGFEYKQCRNCPVLPQCGGGCPHRRLFQAQELHDEEFCYSYLRGDLESRIREYAMTNHGNGRTFAGKSSMRNLGCED
jgi:uncharacterized protein